MPLAVINAVIHGFDKEKHTEIVSNVFKRDKTLDVTQAPVVALVEGVAKLLGKRENSLAWGRFNNDNFRGPFPSSFDACVSSEPDLTDENVFLALTHTAVDVIVEKAMKSRLATGSKILFGYYKYENGNLGLLIAMIKQKGGIRLTEDFVPVDIEQVDMAKLSHASEIKISDYLFSKLDEANQLEQGAELEDLELIPYLSFISSRDTDDAASYFVEALGCELYRSSKRSTSLVIKAAYDFCVKNPALKGNASKVKEVVCNYLKEKMEAGEEASLEEVKQKVERAFPVELSRHFDSFVDTLNGGDYKIPSSFPVSEESLKKYSRIVLKDDDVEIKFEKSDFGTTANSKIQFNRAERYLKIKLSDKQIDELDKHV